jgi:mannan endo-1,6-alpha-mannosidase
MYEPPCELINSCNTDQLSFKAYLSRWLADVTQFAPYTYDTIMTKLRATAEAAVAQCQGGTGGTYCGFRWSSGSYDGTTGVGQQMGVLEVLQGLLAANVSGPLTSSNGGSSKGDASAGTGTDEDASEVQYSAITTADTAGAALLTAMVVGLIISATYMMVT